ncbi:hypothetical protein [Rubellicoccus peritrichatus]|uniref:Uncharacterized protein n=1 Tax=Rubellicoccus peritrichatus TaxID=3080537 RepID=A0AAQ3LGT1_9BACT|nr:hypothetical protein [Puniceicoccus sp. CR14]WOO43543.1 hypothetical protein RZN69_10630 [Puniceicoccus sp. CR14]
MKISKELYNAGILGHQNTRPTEWVFDNPGSPQHGQSNHPFHANRASQSIKVSQKGLRLLANVLRTR